jgi:hypothetical protein
VTIAAPSPGEYVIQVSHKSTIAGQFYGMVISGLSSTRPINYWTGTTGTDWNTASNWTLSHEPLGTETVIIPAGCTNYPVLTGHLRIGYTNVSGELCHTLTIEAGASLSIDDMDIYSQGELTVEGNLYVGDDIFLNNGSVTHLGGIGEIYNGYTSGRHGVLVMLNGSLLNQSGGDLYTEELQLSSGSQYSANGGFFHIYKEGYASATQHIQINDPDSYFFNFKIDTLIQADLYNCAEDLTVTNVSRVSGSLALNGHTMHVYFMHVYGEIVLSSGNLDITQNGPVFYNGASFTMSGGEFTTFNSVWFLGGSQVNVSNGTINIRRDLHNTADAYVPSGGITRFYGNPQSIINGQTAFYRLEVDKDTGSIVYSPFDVTVTDSLIMSNGGLEIINGSTIHIGGEN